MRTFLSNTFSWRSKRPEVFKKELFNVYKTYWKDLQKSSLLSNKPAKLQNMDSSGELFSKL